MIGEESRIGMVEDKVTWLNGYKDPLHGLLDPDSYWLRDRDSSQL